MHHFYSTACETECHGPEGAFACPVDKVVYSGDSVFYIVGGWDWCTRNEFFDVVKSVDLCKEGGRDRDI